MPRTRLPLLIFICTTLVQCVPLAAAPTPEFSIDVAAILSKSGCNAGTCHGNLNGKGGFKLSLRGQDPGFDYRALVHASRGRRVNFSLPEQSLFLKKASGQVAHRGGVRFEPESEKYRVLLEWLRGGGQGPSREAANVVDLIVVPEAKIVRQPETSVAVSVTAKFSDGSTRDVTRQACYELSNLNAEVDSDGVVKRQRFGETTLVVRYLDHQKPVPLTFTPARSEFRWTGPVKNNELDRHVFAKLRRIRVNPSPLSDDNVFVRRAYLDAVGRLPTASEAREFSHSQLADKREELIERLLGLPEFSDFWALKWADVMRTEEKVLDAPGVDAFHQWIRDSIAAAKPMDQFVRELVTASGSTFHQPAANYYRANRDPATRGETTARLFLGVRLQCAKCHNHPFDRWTQDDYYQWSSVFSQIDYVLGAGQRKDRLDKNEFPGDQVVLFTRRQEVRNPTTGAVATPQLLGGPGVAPSDFPRRLEAMADWLTAEDNPLFARSQVNFVWYQLMGRGIVDPIDDFRLTNPPSNEPLLDFLAERFVTSGYDLREVVRTIMRSSTYQLASEPNTSNADDETGFSRAYIRRLPAEVILDMQSDVLGVPAEFAGYPTGIRAVQIPGVQRVRLRDGQPQLGDRFLATFGKPKRILACDCERSSETTLKQVFALLGEGLSERLSAPGNRLHQLAESPLPNAELLQELFWTALSRPPSSEELAAGEQLLGASENRVSAVEDFAWALLNAKEFLFRR